MTTPPPNTPIINTNENLSSNTTTSTSTNPNVPNAIDEYAHFEDMNLKPLLLRGILAYGYENPSEIQRKAIVPFIQHHDLIAQAQSGTGKTATFCIAAIQNVDETVNQTQCIIISHTRELASQTFFVLTSLGAYIPSLKMCLITSNESVNENIQQLQRTNPHIIVATPGRLLHLLEKAYIDPEYVQWIVMDEADNLLSRDFKQQIYDIYQIIPTTIKTGLYTATVTDEMNEISDYFMQHPVRVLVLKEELSLRGIRQYYVQLEHEREKFEVLVDLFQSISIAQSIIYCNKRETSNILLRRIKMKQLPPAECIHGQLTPQRRHEIMKNFRSGSIRILITTDLLARGIDIQQVGLVINYELPMEVESYIHRIGRTGRYGRKGYAINLITNMDLRNAMNIQTYYSTQFELLPRDVATAIKL